MAQPNGLSKARDEIKRLNEVIQQIQRSWGTDVSDLQKQIEHLKAGIESAERQNVELSKVNAANYKRDVEDLQNRARLVEGRHEAKMRSLRAELDFWQTKAERLMPRAVMHLDQEGRPLAE